MKNLFNLDAYLYILILNFDLYKYIVVVEVYTVAEPPPNLPGRMPGLATAVFWTNKPIIT
jgi:hypothetical protein